MLVSEIVEFLRNTYYEQFISLAFLAAWDEVSVSDALPRSVWLTVCLAHSPSGYIYLSCLAGYVCLTLVSVWLDLSHTHVWLIHLTHACLWLSVSDRLSISLTLMSVCLSHTHVSVCLTLMSGYRL